jgi:hypothetical protein
MQCSFNCQTGVIEFRYAGAGFGVGRIDGDGFGGAVNGIVGFARGSIGSTSSVDPQSRDLSCELPFCTKPEGSTSNMGLVAHATPITEGPVYGGRMHYGQTVAWSVNNIPAGSLGGVFVFSAATLCPGLQVVGLTAPSCVLTCPPDFIAGLVLFPPASLPASAPVTIPSACNPGLLGATLCAQFVTLDANAPSLITAASNAWKHTVGLR